jgi:hypothetical protein
MSGFRTAYQQPQQRNAHEGEWHSRDLRPETLSKFLKSGNGNVVLFNNSGARTPEELRLNHSSVHESQTTASERI